MEIILRAHHILCIQGFRGKGYSEKFVANFASIVEQLTVNKDTRIKLIAGPDDICRCCPYFGENGCHRSGSDAERSSQHMDSQVLHKLGLKPGARLSWGKILQELKAGIDPEDLAHICAGCPWVDYNYCLEGLKNLKETPMKNLFLTGRPGIGKTTLVRKLLACLTGEVGGFFTQEIRQGHRRVGFKIRDLQGEEGVLAHINYSSPYRVGKYGVDIAALERVALPALNYALKNSAYIIMDELGKMELYSQAFQKKVVEVLDSPKKVLGVIQQRSNPFLDPIKTRGDVDMIEVTLENRESLLALLKQRLLQGGNSGAHHTR
jgi:nucleoside-triphosphatase